MSVQFWSRKLEDSFVVYKGEYKRVLGIHNPLRDRERLLLEPMPEGYPEDMVDTLEFILDGDIKCKYKDFKIEFPKEGYRMVDGRAVFAGRTMQKAYKLAPSTSNFRLNTNEGDIRLERWLNAPALKKKDFAKPEELFNWDAEEVVFSDRLVARNESILKRGLYYCDAMIGAVMRNEKTMVFRVRDGLSEKLSIFKPWAKDINKSRDYTPDPAIAEKLKQSNPFSSEIRPGRLHPGSNNYIELDHWTWRYRPVSIVDNWDYIVTERREAPSIIAFKWEGMVYEYDSPEQLLVEWELGDTGVPEDIFELMTIYGIAEPGTTPEDYI